MKIWVENSEISNGNTTDVTVSARYIRKRKNVNYVDEVAQSRKKPGKNKKCIPQHHPDVPLPPPLPSSEDNFSPPLFPAHSSITGISSDHNINTSLNTFQPCPTPSNLYKSNSPSSIFPDPILHLLQVQKGQDESMFRMLEIIKGEVKQNTALLLKLQGTNPTAIHEDDFKLPICTIKDLLAFNDCLLDNEYLQKMVNSFGVVGGISTGDMRRILLKLISQELALPINWSGRGKTSFQNFKQILLLIFLREVHAQRMQDACKKREVLEAMVKMEETHITTTKEYSDKAGELDQQLTANKNQSEMLTEQIAAMNHNLATNRNIIHSYHNDQLKMKAQFQKQMDEISLLAKKKEEEIHNRINQLQNTREKYHKLKETHDNTKKQIEKVSTELQAAKVETGMVLAKVMDQSSKVELQHAGLHRLQKQLEQNRARVEQLTSTKEAKEASITALQQHVAGLRSELHNEREENGLTQSAQAEKVNALRVLVQGIEEQTTVVMGQLEKEEPAVSEAKQQLAQQNNKIQSLETELLSLQGDLDAERVRASEMQQVKSNAVSNNEKLSQQLSDTLSQVAKVEEKLRGVASDREELRKKVTRMEVEKEDFMQEQETARKHEEEEREQEAKKIQMLVAQFDKKKHDHLQSHQEKLLSIRQQLQERQDSIDKHKLQASNSEAAFLKLSTEKVNMESRLSLVIEELRAKLKMLRNQQDLLQSMGSTTPILSINNADSTNGSQATNPSKTLAVNPFTTTMTSQSKPSTRSQTMPKGSQSKLFGQLKPLSQYDLMARPQYKPRTLSPPISSSRSKQTTLERSVMQPEPRVLSQPKTFSESKETTFDQFNRTTIQPEPTATTQFKSTAFKRPKFSSQVKQTPFGQLNRSTNILSESLTNERTVFTMEEDFPSSSIITGEEDVASPPALKPATPNKFFKSRKRTATPLKPKQMAGNILDMFD